MISAVYGSLLKPPIKASYMVSLGAPYKDF